MTARRTVPVEGAEFGHLANEINALLVLGGHRRRNHRGSTSWLGVASTKWNKETVFKLTFYGPGDMAFGVRRDFVEERAAALAAKNWPYGFRVPPRTDVEFLGFRVWDDKDSLDRIDRVLVGLGVLSVKPEGPRIEDYDARQKRFDEDLDALGL